MSNKSVYVELSALDNWNKKLNKIDTDAIDIIKNIEAEIKKVEDYWVGNASKGFVEASEELTKLAKSYHLGMKDVDSFLVTVANSMQER